MLELLSSLSAIIKESPCTIDDLSLKELRSRLIIELEDTSPAPANRVDISERDSFFISPVAPPSKNNI